MGSNRGSNIGIRKDGFVKTGEENVKNIYPRKDRI